MKRYFLGLVALLLAVAFSAFTKPANNSNLVEYYFEFDIANFSPTEPNVEDPAKWHLVASPSGCELEDQEACVIRVDESDTEVVEDVRQLKSTTSIVAAQYLTTGVYYVTQAGDVIEPYNNTIPE